MTIILTFFMLATLSGLWVIFHAVVEDILKWSKSDRNKLDK